jgi:hypothetical protein
MGEEFRPSLVERVRLAEARSENVLSLFELLEPAGSGFRQLVLATLTERGFEIGGELPNLQLPQDLAEEIELAGAGAPRQLQQALQQALRLAGQSGMLVDLSTLGVASWGAEPGHATPGWPAHSGIPHSRLAFLGD